MSDRKATFLKEFMSGIEKTIAVIRDGNINLVSCDKKLNTRSVSFAKSLQSAADQELGHGVRFGLLEVSNTLKKIAEERTKTIDHIESTVLERLSQFSSISKSTKDSLAKRNSASEKVKGLAKTITKLNSKTKRDHLKIEQVSTTECPTKTSMHTEQEVLAQCETELDSCTLNLEEQRIDMIKDTLEHYIRSQIYINSRSIEALSSAFQKVSEIESDSDVNGIRKKIESLNRTSVLSSVEADSSDPTSLELK